MELRKAREQDLPYVRALYAAAIGQEGCTWNVYYPGEEEIQYDYNGNGLYVLCEADRVIGAVSVVPENELDHLPCWTETDAHRREIARVVIDRTEQGKGYAGWMLRQLLSLLQAEGCRGVRLLVAEKNTAAIRLYRKLGFRFLASCFEYGNVYSVCEKMLF